MPRRSPPPDRLAAEAALSREEVLVLRAQATAHGIDTECWHLAPTLAVPWGTHATVRLADQIRERSGLSRDKAMAEAASRLGLCEDTIRSRLIRCFQHSRGL